MGLNVFVTVLDSSYKKEYEELLTKAFSTATGFEVKPEGLTWNYFDEYYFNLGLFFDNKLVSVMRLETIFNQKEFNQKLGRHDISKNIQMPAVYLTKAATDPKYKNFGFNSILRLISLKICEQWKMTYLLGTMVAKSPRMNTMRNMGYEFYTAEKNWSGNFISFEAVQIAVLDLKKNQKKAELYLMNYLSKNISSIEVDFELNSLSQPEPIL